MPPFWENDQQVKPAASAQSGPKPVISLPDADKQADNARADASLNNDQIRTGIALRGEASNNQTTAIENAQKLRSGYEQLQPVKEYRVVLPLLMQALKVSGDPTGDNTLLYNYAKAMDPGSVVRESEQGAAANGAGFWDKSVANVKKQFGIEGGGDLSPEVRQRLKRDLQVKVQEMGLMYRQQRQRFANDAKAFGVDPERVIGPDDFEPYVGEWQKLQKQFEQAKDPTNADIYGGGVQFGGGPEGPFDRASYIKDQYGVTPEQEDRVVGFWTANSGNKALSPEQAAAWYQQNGIPAPSPDALGQMVKQAQGLKPGTRWGGFDTSGAEQAYRAKLEAMNKGEVLSPDNPLSTLGLAANAMAFNLGDEAAGVQRAFGAALMGDNPIDAYTQGRDAVRLQEEQIRQANPGLATGAELAGGLVGGLMLPSNAASRVSSLAKEGAAYGALQGFGSGEGVGGSIGGAIMGGTAGGALGAGAGKIGQRLANRAPGEGAAVIQAADDLNAQFGTKIAPLPADVSGPGVRRVTGGAAQLPLAASSIVKGAQGVADEAAKARDAIAALAGTAATPEAAGEAALTGARKFIQTSRNKVNALYTKARKLGGDQPVDLAEARNALDANIAELSQVPGGADGLAYLQSLRAELDNPASVEAVRQMRTQMRDKFIGDGLRGSDLERRVGQVLDAADTDITNSLNAAGKGEAARAYAAASAAHKERVEVIDQVLAPIIGNKGDAPKSVEQIMGAIETATKTNGSRLGKFLSSLPAEDAATIRATLISRLGKATNGTQNAAGDAFSLPQFLTQWNQMSGAAKSQLFGGELRAALENLAKVAEGTKEAQRFANFSNTGGTIGLLATGAGGTQIFAHPIATVAGLAGQYGLGKLLSSPSFARWLAKVPSDPGAMPAHVKALTRIAANDNAIAAEVAGLQERLLAQFGQGIRARASGPTVAPPQSSGEAGTERPRAPQ